MYNSYEDYYIKKLNKDDLALYLGFKEYLKSEMYRVAYEVNQVLSRGLDKIDEAERKAYYESEEYKKAVQEKNVAEAAKAAEEAKYVEHNKAEWAKCNEYNNAVLAKYVKQTAGREGKYRGIDKSLSRLGYWSPASADHIGHIMGDDPSYDERPKLMSPKLMHSSIKVPVVKEYVPKKSVEVKKARVMKYRNKYNNLSTVIGLLFLFMDCGRLDSDFENYVRSHYKNYKQFSLSEALAPLRKEFPKSIANGIIDIDYKPTVKNLSHIIATSCPADHVTEIVVDTGSHPDHEKLIGLKMGDSFKLTNIDHVYTVLYIYSYSPCHR